MKVLIICMALIALTGCGGFDQSVCYEGVKAAYPDANVVIIPGEKYRFIVEDVNGDIIYVETMNRTGGGVVTQAFTAVRAGNNNPS